MFPGARDPVGPAVAFRMAHVLLFPVEMPTDKGCLVGASCTPSSGWPSRGQGPKLVHVEGRFAPPCAPRLLLPFSSSHLAAPDPAHLEAATPRGHPDTTGQAPTLCLADPTAAKPKPSTRDGGDGATGGGILTLGESSQA